MLKKILNFAIKSQEINLIKNFDCFFLSYDEPNKEENWSQIRSLIPHAKRVDNIKGFDAAHKICAKNAITDRLLIIDGDNQIKESILGLTVKKELLEKPFVLSYSSTNIINGLCYGNGGLKCWPKDVLLNTKSHEATTQKQNASDFCFSTPYYQVPLAPTISIMNATPYQAFRAGFREGVKMCLINGNPPEFTQQKKTSIIEQVPKNNFFRLKVWLEIGRHIQNGDWAIYGARLGVKELMLNSSTIYNISSYEWFEKLWTQIYCGQSKVDDRKLKEIAENIKNFLGYDIQEVNAHSSRQFVEEIINPQRKGLMFPERGDH